MESIKNQYIQSAKKIIDANEKMACDSFKFIEMFRRKNLRKYKGNLSDYYNWLREYDDEYSQFITTDGTINDLNFKLAKINIASKAREIFIVSLGNYEKELSNIEGNLNFLLSTSIALVAIVISILISVLS